MGIRGLFCLAAMATFGAVGCGSPESSLAFIVQPTDGVAGAAFSPSIQVAVVDRAGHPVANAEQDITLAVSGGPGGALAGTTKARTHNGVATFNDLSIRQAGTGYALSATANKLDAATSNPFAINPAAVSKLIVQTQPSDSTAGAAIGPPVQVVLQDGFGNLVVSATASVTAALAANPGNDSMAATTVPAVNGVATFSALSVSKSASGYTLAFSTPGVFSATSSAFKVSPGAVSKLVFTTGPSNATAGAALPSSVVVTAQDSKGNTVPSFTGLITLAFSTNAGGGTLSGTAIVKAVGGVATFPGLSVDKAGQGYTLKASSGSLTSPPSAVFNVTPAGASGLSFVVPPSNVVAGAALSQAVQVAVVDALGNRVTSSAASITLVLAGTAGGTLLGTRTQSSVNGVATFSGLSIAQAGTYTLTAGSGSLTGATSLPFIVAPGTPVSLVFVTQPSNTVAGQIIAPAVAIQDTYGNTVTTSSAGITLALAANPGGGSLQGTLSQPASSGVGTFGDLVLQKAAKGYQLSATSAGLPPMTSNLFDVSPAAPTQLSFAVPPSNSNVGQPLAPAVQVVVQDSFGNPSNVIASVTVALVAGPTATLGGTLIQSTVGGTATFGGLTVNTKGAGYTLKASSNGLPSITSNPFSVFQPSLVYTNPAMTGKIALVQNAATTSSIVVLDLVTLQSVTGYAVGMNLPVDITKVLPDAKLMTPGTALPAGLSSAVPAFAAALPTSGPLANVLTSGQSQKAGGSGAVTTDTTVPTGTVLYSLRLDVNPVAGAGTVFDGAAIATNPKFRALMRDKLGTDVATSTDFAIGKLEVQLQ